MMIPRVQCDEAKFVDLARKGLANAEIAARFQVTVRTLDRWRAAHPGLTDAIKAARVELLLPCGTEASYVRGCRCDLCRGAHARYDAERRTRRLSRPIPEKIHGKASTYGNWGCRCQPCTAAHSAMCKAQHRRRVERAAAA